MGNDSDKKDKINSEFITFELIQESLGLKTKLYSKNIFKKYLQTYQQKKKNQKQNIYHV